MVAQGLGKENGVIQVSSLLRRSGGTRKDPNEKSSVRRQRCKSISGQVSCIVLVKVIISDDLFLRAIVSFFLLAKLTFVKIEEAEKNKEM